MKPADLGRYGEDVVAGLLGFRRVPSSGARWPRKEDLVREEKADGRDDDGTYDEVVVKRELAQVKTTQNKSFWQAWRDLEVHARILGAKLRWFDVVVTADEVQVFERVLVRKLKRGLGGEVSR